MIGIIDYGMGNLGSVSNACRFLDLDARVISRPAEVPDCNALILPGVGGFGDCMNHLREHGLVEPVQEWIAADLPFLGICMGLQVLVEGSDESPGIAGLGVLPGRVVRFSRDPGLKVPQIGWNAVRQVRSTCPLFHGIEDESYFYFVHSYYVDTPDRDLVAGVTSYGKDFTSCIWRGNLAAVQFHPEKSQQKGLRLLRNFSEACLKTA